MQTDKTKFKQEFLRRLIQFSIQVIQFTDQLKLDKVSYSVIDQLIRSATSIGANVIEAKASSSKREYIKFFEIALKSANETKYWLLIVKAIQPKHQSTSERLLKESIEIANILGSSILTLKGKKQF